MLQFFNSKFFSGFCRMLLVVTLLLCIGCNREGEDFTLDPTPVPAPTPVKSTEAKITYPEGQVTIEAIAGNKAAMSVQHENVKNPVYKWQKYDSGSKAFKDIGGDYSADKYYSSDITTEKNTGDKYRCIVTGTNAHTN